MRFSSKAVAGLMLAGMATTTLAACGSSDKGGDAADDLCGKKLAFMGALTGDAGALGQNMLGGVKLALDEYNKDNADCEIGLEEFDSQGDPTKAPALATQIVNDESIVGLIGPGFSGESNATGKTFFEAGLPSISPSATNVTLTQQGWTTWHRVIGNDAAQGAADAKYLTETLGEKKIYLVSDVDDYSKGLAKVVAEGLGDAKVGQDKVQTGQTDMSAVVTKVKASGADAVFYAGYYAEAGLLAKQLRQAGFEGTFMSGDGAQDPAFVKAAGAEAANGAWLSAPAAPAPADFGSKYKDVVGADAGLYSTQAYDATNIFLAAIDDGAADSKAINDFIGSYKGDGASGPIEFDKNGDVTSTTIYAYTVKDGVMDVKTPVAIK